LLTPLRLSRVDRARADASVHPSAYVPLRPRADDTRITREYGWDVTTTDLRRWIDSTRLDLLLAALVLVVEVVGTELLARVSGGERPGAIGYALLVVIAASVAVRNRYPVQALAIAAAGAALYSWLDQPGPFWTAALVFAIWASVSAGHRIATLAIGVLFVAAILIAGFIVRAGHAAGGEAPVWLVAWLLAAFVLGEVSRGRREYIAHLEQRALDAERTREEEAARRAGEERLRIARELHDILAHSISVINVQAGVAVHLLDKQPDQARKALIAINDASKEAMRDLRATLGVLRQSDDTSTRAPAPGLDRLGELVEGARAAGLDVRLTTTGEPVRLPAAADLAAYRIVQESLTNVTRHAGAAQVDVSISHAPGEVRITVENDGTGVPVGAAFRPGNGIAGMRERAAAVGGDLDAGVQPGGGFRVHARLPIS
jgi:signal transduction histidine kinase